MDTGLSECRGRRLPNGTQKVGPRAEGQGFGSAFAEAVPLSSVGAATPPRRTLPRRSGMFAARWPLLRRVEAPATAFHRRSGDLAAKDVASALWECSRPGGRSYR